MWAWSSVQPSARMRREPRSIMCAVASRAPSSFASRTWSKWSGTSRSPRSTIGFDVRTRLSCSGSSPATESRTPS